MWPDGRKEIEGVTPKALPAPASHTLPSDASSAQHARDMVNKDKQYQ